MRTAHPGSVVVITGASGGLGRELCRRFAHAGANIGALDLDKRALDKLQKELRAEFPQVSVRTAVCDVTKEAACRRAIASIQKTFERIDVLINNAGISHRSAFRHTSPAVLRKVMEVSYYGSVHCTSAALDALLESHGSIIGISSPAGYGPLVARTGYSAAKHAMHGFFDSLRTELPKHMHVMLVCPAFTNTGIGRNSLSAQGKPLGTAQRSVGAFLEPDYVADSIYRGWQKERELLLIGKSAISGYWLNKFAPRLYRKLMLSRLRDELQS